MTSNILDAEKYRIAPRRAYEGAAPTTLQHAANLAQAILGETVCSPVGKHEFLCQAQFGTSSTMVGSGSLRIGPTCNATIVQYDDNNLFVITEVF